MVAEPWILKMGNQVSTNFKHALYLENSTKTSNAKKQPQGKVIIGILSFEVANIMSKIIHLHKSMTDSEIIKLKNEILKGEGIKTLVSSDENQLLQLALVEKIDELNRVASVVSRLGKRCTIPALRGFEHVYSDIVSGVIEVKALGFLVKDMENMMRKMERYVNSTASLYAEMEVTNELEAATKKFRQNQLEETRKAFEQKLTWQKQDVKHLKDVSLWNQTYDKIVEILARTVCTIYSRIYAVFGDADAKGDISSRSISRSITSLSGSLRSVKQKDTSLTKSMSTKSNGNFHSGPISKNGLEKRTSSFRPKTGSQRSENGFPASDMNFQCGMCQDLSEHRKYPQQISDKADEWATPLTESCATDAEKKEEDRECAQPNGRHDQHLFSYF